MLENRKAIEESKWDVTTRTLHFKRAEAKKGMQTPEIFKTKAHLKHVVTGDYSGHSAKKHGNYDYGDGPLFSSSRALNLSNTPIDGLTDMEVDRIRHDNYERLGNLKKIHEGMNNQAERTGVVYKPNQLSFSKYDQGRLQQVDASLYGMLQTEKDYRPANISLKSDFDNYYQ